MPEIIREVMHRGVVTCKVDATVAQIAKTMLANDVSALVVIDEHLNACGVVTKTDLLACYGKDLSSVTAEDIMTTQLCTVLPDTSVHAAVQLMLQRKIHQLVIVSQGAVHHRPVGIFTSGDAICLMAGESGPRSDAEARCSDCIRRLLSVTSKQNFEFRKGPAGNQVLSRDEESFCGNSRDQSPG